MFFVQFLFSLFLGKKIKRLKGMDDKINQELTEYIELTEKERSLKSEGLFRLRVLELFTKIKEENKREEIRNHMKDVVINNNGRPVSLMFLYFFSLLFSALCIYFLALCFKSEPVLWISIVANILVIFFWISRKRWIFSILFGVFGYIVYPHLAGHIVLYIGLNMLKIIFASKRKKKS